MDLVPSDLTLRRPLGDLGLRGDVSTAAWSVVEDIAHKLKDPNSVREFFMQGAAKSFPTARGPWNPAGLAFGTAGTSMLFSALSRATGNKSWADVSHQHLICAASTVPQPLGLFYGWGGLLAAAQYCKTPERSYENIRARISDKIEHETAELVTPPFAKPRNYFDIDLLGGLAGYWLLLSIENRKESCQKIHDYFKWLFGDDSGAGWRMPATDEPGRVPENILGVAHGIAGVLAAASLSDGPKNSELISMISAFLVANATITDEGPRWGYARPVRGIGFSHRVAWCHGTLGVALALLMAGDVIGHEHLGRLSISILESVAKSDKQTWGIVDHAICHGSMGCALVFQRASRTGASVVLQRVATELVSQTVYAHNKKHPLGYRTPNPAGEPYDSAELLNGSAGIALSLLTMLAPVDLSWLVYFGLR
jgi:lantibiotic modifying enzyme